MWRILVGCLAISLFLMTVISAQNTPKPAPPTPAGRAATQATPPNPPDMVCFGEEPNWSIQFVSWGARYIGINQPNRDFLGGYVWVPDEKVWAWQETNKFGMPTGSHELSAVVRKAACAERKERLPYSAMVTMPEGDIVNGCCRKLKPGEAPVAPNQQPSTNRPQR